MIFNMTEANLPSFKSGIIDFNPNRMTRDQTENIGMPEELRVILGDFRQYPLNIAQHFPEGVIWFSQDKPWFYRDIFSNPDHIASLQNNEVLILSGSGMSAYKFQERTINEFTSEDLEYLGKSQKIIKNMLGQGKWILGICFGGQLAIHAVGGKLGRLPEDESGISITEAGWLDHRLTDAGKYDEIFSLLPDNFSAPQLHNDFVAALPKVGTIIETTDNPIKVVRSEVLAIRKGFLGRNGIQNYDQDYIQASLVEFNNGARLYQLQPHPEMASPKKANFLVRQNPWIEGEMGEKYFQQALTVPDDADFSISNVITLFIESARSFYERRDALVFARSVVGQKLDQFIPYLLT